MKVKLTVVQGKPEGKEFVLPKNPFVIGRGKKCHLRPNNDAVGEQHCAIIAKADSVIVRDLGSPSGTQVNGRKVDGEVTVKTGDLLQVGPLVFAITLLKTQKKPAAAAKSPAPKPVQASASSSAPPNEEDEDVDVTDWLGGADEATAPEPAAAEKSPAAIREPVFDDMDLAQDSVSGATSDDSSEAGDGEENSDKKPAGSDSASTSRAASDLLRKYFTRPRE
jgi:pSer/pThr/pTyr-binding forkhead associated (FHA) protein